MRGNYKNHLFEKTAAEKKKLYEHVQHYRHTVLYLPKPTDSALCIGIGQLAALSGERLCTDRTQPPRAKENHEDGKCAVGEWKCSVETISAI